MYLALSHSKWGWSNCFSEVCFPLRSFIQFSESVKVTHGKTAWQVLPSGHFCDRAQWALHETSEQSDENEEVLLVLLYTEIYGTLVWTLYSFQVYGQLRRYTLSTETAPSIVAVRITAAWYVWLFEHLPGASDGGPGCLKTPPPASGQCHLVLVTLYQKVGTAVVPAELSVYKHKAWEVKSIPMLHFYWLVTQFTWKHIFHNHLSAICFL